ncbi:MAG: glutamate--tRNA ligase [Pseudomonadota bacterium]
MSVVTRFAPSPTGMLHIGGARTALFNILFSRRHNGRFLLRIEDTDRARSTKDAVDAILDGLDWLGITPDEAPVYQTSRAADHIDCARAMIENGTAFKCYATPEDLQARRERGEANRNAAKADELSDDARASLLALAAADLGPYRSPWRDGGPPPASDAPYTIRLRAPDTGSILLKDEVQGEISIDASEVDDLILLRADGTPTYMLAVVVDDHNMGITHVIRGDDHLRNTFRQIPIYQAMGWPIPTFAHVPMIHGPDGAKLSKRHGALGIAAYREMGYLPEAINNYLLRLGWSHGDWEIFSLEDAADVFSLSGIGRAPARIDFDKLSATNGHYIRTCDLEQLTALVEIELSKTLDISPRLRETLRTSLAIMRDRGDTIPALAEAYGFITATRPLVMNKKARKTLKGETLDRLAIIRDEIAAAAQWRAETLKITLADIMERQELTIGQLGPPLRAALTGGLPAPDIDLVMEWLGKDECLARIDDQLKITTLNDDGHEKQ